MQFFFLAIWNHNLSSLDTRIKSIFTLFIGSLPVLLIQLRFPMLRRLLGFFIPLSVRLNLYRPCHLVWLLLHCIIVPRSPRHAFKTMLLQLRWHTYVCACLQLSCCHYWWNAILTCTLELLLHFFEVGTTWQFCVLLINFCDDLRAFKINM